MLCSLRGRLSPRTWALSFMTWLSLTISNALFLPLPANELTASQPVNACKLRRTRHMLGPSFSHSRGTLIKRDLLLDFLFHLSRSARQEWLIGGDMPTLQHWCPRRLWRPFDDQVKMRVTHGGTSVCLLPLGRYTVPLHQLLSYVHLWRQACWSLMLKPVHAVITWL